MTKTRPELEHENEVLRNVIGNTFWMARRYANGRKTYAPDTVNQCLRDLETIDVIIKPDQTLVQDGNSNADILDIK